MSKLDIDNSFWQKINCNILLQTKSLKFYIEFET